MPDSTMTDETAEFSYWDSLTHPKPFIFGVLVIIGLILEIVVHLILNVSVVYTHYFYLVIVLAGLWYQKTAIWYALFFGGLYVIVDFFHTGGFDVESFIRVLILCLVAIVVGVVADRIIVLQKRLITQNTQLKVSQKALESANKKLNLLSSITRHDINNQLTALLAFLELTKMQSGDPVIRDYIIKEEDLAHNIQRQVAFSRDYEEIGVHAPQWQNVETLVLAVQQSRQLGTIQLQHAVHGLEILADPLLEKIFSNLIDNSLRHGERVGRISVSCRITEPSLSIVYEDDGTGIAQSEKERIFEKGFGKNTGMGLFLSREILDITGLTIRETGTVGAGARFEIAVPAGKFRFATDSPAAPGSFRD
jgi:signal transduction histidine kinase